MVWEVSKKVSQPTTGDQCCEVQTRLTAICQPTMRGAFQRYSGKRAILHWTVNQGSRRGLFIKAECGGE